MNELAQLIGAFAALAITNYYLGNFEASGQYAFRGAELWRSGGAQSTVEEVDVPGIACICYVALFQWHTGHITSAYATIQEAISLERELNDMHGLAVALNFAACFACGERNVAEVKLYSSELIELSTCHRFAYWMALGAFIAVGRAAFPVRLLRAFRGSSRE